MENCVGACKKQLCENFNFSSGLTEKPFLCANPGETTHSTGKLCPIACMRTNSSHYNHMPFPSAFRAEVLLSVVNPLEGMRRGQRRNSHPFTTSVIARDGAGWDFQYAVGDFTIRQVSYESFICTLLYCYRCRTATHTQSLTQNGRRKRKRASTGQDIKLMEVIAIICLTDLTCN